MQHHDTHAQHASKSGFDMTHALIVDFEIKLEWVDRFARAIAENAALSLQNEPGCTRFDVCRDPLDACRFFLYELYVGPEAIKAHLESRHFQDFNALTLNWVAKKSVRTQVLMTP